MTSLFPSQGHQIERKDENKIKKKDFVCLFPRDLARSRLTEGPQVIWELPVGGEGLGVIKSQ